MDRLANRVALVVVIVGGLSLSGCATVESVERAQASADAAGAAAMHAQGSADAAGSAANAAGDAAKKAQETADAAGTMASDGLKTTNERIDKSRRRCAGWRAIMATASGATPRSGAMPTNGIPT